MDFYKMQGTGNDFIVIDNRDNKYGHEKMSSMAMDLCRRRLSIGADGFIAIEQSSNEEKWDFSFVFYNSDGHMVEMCGNGVRCAAKYAYDNKIADENMKIETLAGEIFARRINENTYEIKMNKINKVLIDEGFGLSEEIFNKLKNDNKFFCECEVLNNYKLCESIKYSYVEIGNPGIPHVFIYCKNIENIENMKNKNKKILLDIAREIRYSNLFEGGTNVSFYGDYDKTNKKIEIITYERGVEDFTLGCGTAASSLVYMLQKKKICDTKEVIMVKSLGGEVGIKIEKIHNKDEDIYLVGETLLVIKGNIEKY